MNLFDLAFTSYLYDAFTSFNTSYKDFQNTVDHKLDLSIIKHRKAMITWLNQWGCRQFSRACHGEASDEILSWYQEGFVDLIPNDKDLWELSDQDLGLISVMYDKLATRTASHKMRAGRELSITIGPTGASKILFALKPRIVVPWDEAMRVELGYDGSGVSYIEYLKRVKAEIESLMVSCHNNDIELQDVPKTFRRDATIPQLVGEYYWVTLTRNCYPPPAATIRCWAKWKLSPVVSLS